MVLIDKNITKSITILENLLENSIEKEKTVCIHGNFKEFIIRYTSVLDEFFINHEELCLVCGWFEIDIKKIITDIIYNEDENSVHITFSEGELYIDFNDFEDNL